MVFKMISRHWQTRVNGNSAANASLIQHVRRCGNEVTLLGSESFSMILSASMFYPHLVWGPLPHFSLLFIFLQFPAQILPRLGLGYTKDGVCPLLPVTAGSGGRWYRASTKEEWEMKVVFPEAPKSKKLGWAADENASCGHCTLFITPPTWRCVLWQHGVPWEGEVRGNPLVKISMALL